MLLVAPFPGMLGVTHTHTSTHAHAHTWVHSFDHMSKQSFFLGGGADFCYCQHQEQRGRLSSPSPLCPLRTAFQAARRSAGMLLARNTACSRHMKGGKRSWKKGMDNAEHLTTALSLGFGPEVVYFRRYPDKQTIQTCTAFSLEYVSGSRAWSGAVYWDKTVQLSGLTPATGIHQSNCGGVKTR